jgi:hypothetical protein
MDINTAHDPSQERRQRWLEKNDLIARRLVRQQARRRQPPDSALRHTDQIAERTTSRLQGCQDVSGIHAFYSDDP